MSIEMYFAERLQDLILIKNISSQQLAKILSVDKTSIYNYLNKKSLPFILTALKMSKYFEHTIEYILGRTDNERYNQSDLLPFSERLKQLFDFFHSNEYQLSPGARISRSRTYGWLSGTSIPSLDNIIKIADYYSCTVDFVLGLEK